MKKKLADALDMMAYYLALARCLVFEYVYAVYSLMVSVLCGGFNL